MLRYTILFIVFKALCIPLYSQNFEPQFKRLDAENISITSNMEIYQDKLGYIWMGSRSSLQRFDGSSIRTYTDDELSNHYFTSSFVNLVFESSDNRLWAVTNVGALMVYDRELDRFNIVNDSASSLKNTGYCEFTDAKGNFWIGTMGAGLFYYDPITGALKNYVNKRGDSTSIPTNTVLDITQGADGNIWVATINGLCKINSGDSTFTRVPLTNSDPSDTYRYRVLRDVHAGGDGKLYVSSYRGLHVLDYATLTSKHILSNPDDRTALSHNSLLRIAEDKAGLIWIATYGGGLNCYDPRTEKFKSWQADSSDPHSISSNNIFEVSIDHNQQLWIGTADEGICIMKTWVPPVHVFRHRPGNDDILPSGFVREMMVENDSIIWLGYNGDGLVKFNYRNGKGERFVHDPGNPRSLSHNAVSGLTMDSNGNIWVGLEGGGVNLFDQKTGSFTRHRYQPNRNALANDAVSALHFSKTDNKLWITEYGDGVDIYDPKKNTFAHTTPQSLLSKTGINARDVFSITEIKDQVWLFSNEGFVIFNKRDSTFNGYTTSAARPRILWAEMIDYKGSVVLLSGNNLLFQFQVDDKQVTRNLLFTFPRKSPVTAITAAGDLLWGITSKSIVRYDVQSKEYTEYDPGSALLSRNFLHKMTHHNDIIFFSHDEGLAWFNGNELRESDYSPPVVLTDFKVFNISVTIDAEDTTKDAFTIPQHISALKEIHLSHRESFFSFDFTAMEYYSPDRIEYTYQMKGFDKEWVGNGNRRFASYTSLDPGSYTFLVRATNGHGGWVESKPIRVIIHPPFWKTAWFIGLEILAAFAVIYFLHRYKVAQTVKLERLRNKIASDLHDEVGSSLTRISLYSDMLEQKNGSADQKKYLTGIHHLSREVISTMSDIVWSVDNRSDSLGDLVLRMKDFANEVLSSKNVEVAFDVTAIDEKKVLDPALKQNLYLIFKESINNIVKHAEGTKVLISITNQNAFRMEIHDNGKGFGTDGNYKGHGLRNMNRRASNINARLDIQSHGKGTVVLLQREVL